MTMSPRIVYLVTEDWYFVSHRLPMARAARAAGFEVHVATRVDRHGADIEAEGFQLHHLSWQRGNLDPRRLWRIVRDVRRLYRRIEPSLAHHVALQASVIGSLAALRLPVTCLNALTGLGTTFTANEIKLRLVRAALSWSLSPLLNRTRSAVLVQNSDDRAAIERLGVDAKRIALIPGSGVDIRAFSPTAEPTGAITIAFAGRLVETKGVRVLVAAHDILCGRGRDIRLLIAGVPDPANPTSIPEREIATWRGRRNLVVLGYVQDIAGLWASANVAVLPSLGGEGVPASLLEAAACGRPLVATDVPGCREIARADVNAFLVPPDDSVALADAIDRLAGDADLRRRFGLAGRQIVESEFSDERVGRDVVRLYRHLLNDVGRADGVRYLEDWENENL
jgi:glycosyltransferase involved in cell wall biosynthesis